MSAKSGSCRLHLKFVPIDPLHRRCEYGVTLPGLTRAIYLREGAFAELPRTVPFPSQNHCYHSSEKIAEQSIEDERRKRHNPIVESTGPSLYNDTSGKNTRRQKRNNGVPLGSWSDPPEVGIIISMVDRNVDGKEDHNGQDQLFYIGDQESPAAIGGQAQK